MPQQAIQEPSLPASGIGLRAVRHPLTQTSAKLTNPAHRGLYLVKPGNPLPTPQLWDRRDDSFAARLVRALTLLFGYGRRRH
jgi:hypothetical protein